MGLLCTHGPAQHDPTCVLGWPDTPPHCAIPAGGQWLQSSSDTRAIPYLRPCCPPFTTIPASGTYTRPVAPAGMPSCSCFLAAAKPSVKAEDGGDGAGGSGASTPKAKGGRKPKADKGAGKEGEGDGKPAKKERKKKDPNAPKKALSGFMYFSNANRDKIKAENPGGCGLGWT